MANLRNEFEFRSALLTALGQEHTEAEAKNEEMWRRKMLDGLGVEYDQNDVNQFGLFREKLVEGVANYSGGGGETWNTVFEGSVTTVQESDETPVADLSEVADLSADTIKVTFNGTEYTCEKQTTEVGVAYGDPFDGGFSEYPFRIDINPRTSSIQTQSAGTYTLKIEEPQSGGASDFSTAKVNIITQTGQGASGAIYNVVYINNEDELNQTNVDGLRDEWNIVLYKGTGTYGAEGIISVEGSASYDSEEETITITGDCTVTLYYSVG